MARALISDIVSNPRRIEFTLIEAHYLVESLESHDLSVINGNFAISGGLNISDALYNEVLTESYFNVIAVRTEDLSETFVRDIIDVVRSTEYVNIITDPNGKFAAFQRPFYFLGIMR
jgi:D-methionine transport system substrate-binding protein